MEANCDKCMHQKACTNIFASHGITGDPITECSTYEKLEEHDDLVRKRLIKEIYDCHSLTYSECLENTKDRYSFDFAFGTNECEVQIGKYMYTIKVSKNGES